MAINIAHDDGETITTEREETATRAILDPVVFDGLIEDLAGENRRKRQRAAGAIMTIAKRQPDILVPVIADLADALHRPEAQTRWQVLEALAVLAPFDAEACEEAVAGAREAAYDEESSFAHLAAVRFLCAYGRLDEARSEVVWPTLDEVIQCYHGDYEFQEMLDVITEFAQGSIAAGVKAGLAERMRFDATLGRGTLARKAKEIVRICEK